MAVKTELEYNMYDMDVKLKFYDEEIAFSRYLQTINSQSEISRDTVAKYGDGIYAIFNYYYKHDAFDMLKSSESAHQLNDIDFLLNIMEAYRTLQFVKESTDYTMNKKDEILANTLDNAKQESFINFFGTKDSYRLYKFFLLNESASAEYKMRASRKVVQETIGKIDEKLRTL